MTSDIAVLSTSNEFSIFSAVGADVFVVIGDEEAQKKLNEFSLKYKLIIISESLAVNLVEEIKKYEIKPYPMILCLPDMKKSDGFAMKQLVKKVKEALGLDVFKERK